MFVKQMLGVYYPDNGKLQPLSYTFQFAKDECENAGYLFIEGYCFEVPMDKLRAIERYREYIGGGKLIEYLFAILEVE